jgi:hypothetical protein
MSAKPQQATASELARRHTIAYRVALYLLIGVACLLVISTYSVFGHTWDEPEHIAAGMALVDKGEYPYDTQHPPLARMAMALGPYLVGAHSHGNSGPSGEQEGRDILYSEGHYDSYLTLARLGMLPFLVLLLWTTWAWTRHTFGSSTALLATALVVATPVVIGHAAVAALDVPMTATTMLALYMLLRWFDKPTIARALIFGVASGIAAGTKLSAIPFIGCALIAWSIAYLTNPTRTKDDTPELPSIQRLAGQASSAAIAALIAVCLCYGFGFAPLSSSNPIPVPVGLLRFIDSLSALTTHNTDGHLSFFMGDLRRTGWWDFYLVALAVKTPLPLLICALAGSAWSLRRAIRERSWEITAPVLAFATILLFCSSYSHINIGVRHVMILFPLMAMIAAAFATNLWQLSSHLVTRGILLSLAAWQLVSVAYAHPDYLAYFNAIAGSHPEKILVDSDLDWGQDMRRLENELHARKITEFSLVYRGTADLPHENLPHYKRLWSNDRTTGWIAVSLLAKASSEDGGYKWLDAYQPVMRVGKSIDLYYIEEGTRR